MTTQGCCRYCGEFRMVEVADGADQRRIDEKATKECECEMASMLNFFSQAGMYEEREQEFCENIVRSLMGSMIESLSFKYQGTAFTLTQLADGRFKVKKRRTESEERKF